MSKRKWEEPPLPEHDPITSKSLSIPIAISSLLLMLSLVWALYDEGWGTRPWKGLQEEFVTLYRDHLESIKPQREERITEIRGQEAYQELSQKFDEETERVRPQLQEIEGQEAEVREELRAITTVFTTQRSLYQATRYRYETASESSKEGIWAELEEIRASSHEVDFSDGQTKSYTYEQLDELFGSLKARQGDLQRQKAELLTTQSDLRRQLNEYVGGRIAGLTPIQTQGLIAGLDNFRVEIKQIHNPEMKFYQGSSELIDRCESCHLGTREPLELKAEDMGGKAIFASHPRPELLQIHDPETLGCTPCHNGSGIGTVSVEKAHGFHEFWLWPLYQPASDSVSGNVPNYDAGCVHCHQSDYHFPGNLGSVAEAGKDLFTLKGCWGCHPREGFDRERIELRDVERRLSDLQAAHVQSLLDIDRAIEQGDTAESNEAADSFYQQAENLTLQVEATEAEIEVVKARGDELLMEVKRQGPNLKEAALKLRKEWIPVWIKAPHTFRPRSKMPQFRLSDEQVQAISAFIWQSAIQAPIQKRNTGDATRGKVLFETRGCMGCHSVGEEGQEVGGTFAANLNRVGEKMNYDYLVRWVQNPKERTLPYDPVLRRDLTPQDYQNQGVPFKFDLQNRKSPFGDYSLQVQNPTVMPSLRLTESESEDIASYLMTLKDDSASYPPAPFLDNPELFEEGKFLTRHFGCAGCHEISSLEDEGKIGTELTKEGSKPIERLDFSLLTHVAEHDGWYNHKGFFERKLQNPAVFDTGKEDTKQPLERLRMPKPSLEPEEVDSLVTYLLGSVESNIPPQWHYQPVGAKKDVQEGWRIVKKYNCMGCHQLEAGQQTVLESLPQFQGADGQEKLPPPLVGQGNRTNPDWLGEFLSNPALTREDPNRNGVRSYLQVRMPTFNLSDNEIQTLQKFFAGLSKQPLPYRPEAIEPLSQQELRMARELFTHPAAPCLRCHATGDPVADRDATAPNFLLVRERLQADWTKRWLVHPEVIQPGTAMPSGLFRWDGQRWVFALAELPSFQNYERDHAELLTRYMFQFDPAEQRRLTGR